ncbi:hypothetical protein F4810DRAFT_675749 [Camillea tinctor]|nr:hypothetical protein F4810DRAFT_675749 [Camillea tinctor]
MLKLTINKTVVDCYGRSILHILALSGEFEGYVYIRGRHFKGLDPDAADNCGYSPWECLLWRQRATPENLMFGSRRLHELEVCEFEKLLQEIRERNWAAGLFLYSKKLSRPNQYGTIEEENVALNEMSESDCSISDDEFFDAIDDL